MVSGRTKSTAFFIFLGSLLVALAVALQVGWIYISWRTGLLFVLGVCFFLIIISGVVLNTIFLVREIRRNEQHDAFINAVTHELKTPIASMRLYLETLQHRELEPAKRQEFYQIMLDDSDRLLSLVEQVLRAGRAGQTKQQHTTRVDLRTLVQDSLQLARTRHHLEPASVQFIDTVAEDDAVIVQGDQEELQAAVTNLIDNAIKYSQPRVRVSVEIDRLDNRQVAVRVRDQGVGIPTNELKRIFKRFYRVPTGVALRVKGTGLGLFIVRSVARRHGGRVFAESEGMGHGSTFTLQLPTLPH